MKKESIYTIMRKKLIVWTILVVTIMVFLLVGCEKAEAELDVMQEEVKESEVRNGKETEVQEKEQKEEEPKVQEEVAEEEKNEEIYNGMPVAQVETTVPDIYAFLDYSETLEEPALLIYNEQEGYIINMGEGEYYQLKKDDRIFEYCTERCIGSSDTLEAGGGDNIAKEVDKASYVYEMHPDYSQYKKPHEVIYTVSYTGEWEKEEDYFLLTCYFDAPAE